MSDLDPSKLTAGTLDGYAKHAFKYGACAALAMAIHDAKKWPIVAITDHHNVFEDGTAGGGSALHWVVRRPDGMLIDIDGAHTADELVEEYSGEADDGVAAAGTSTRADAEEWYVESQGEPIRIALAMKFVDVVIENAKNSAPVSSHDDDDPDPWQDRVNAFLGAEANAIYEKLIDITDAGPFDGGCVLFAQALQSRLGGEIWALVGPFGADHAVLKVNDIFIDAAGPGTLEQVIASFNAEEFRGVELQLCRPLADTDLPDARRSTTAAQVIGELLGDDATLRLKAGLDNVKTTLGM